MAKVEINAITQHFRGMLGDIVFRRRFGRLISALRPKPSLLPPTEAQRAQRGAFKDALSYAKKALSDPAIRPVYERASELKQNDMRSLAVGDYFNFPEVRKIDLSAFHGHIGDKIGIMAEDDVAVRKVDVVVRKSDGTILEQGPAVLLHDEWVYTMTTAIAAGLNLIFEATATDWPGNEGRANKLYP